MTFSAAKRCLGPKKFSVTLLAPETDFISSSLTESRNTEISFCAILVNHFFQILNTKAKYAN